MIEPIASKAENVTEPPWPNAARVSSPGDEFWQDTLVLAIFTFGLAFLISANPYIFSDGDTGWHIAAGEWMLVHGSIPYTDPFSYAAFGKPWVAHEWLSEVIMAWAFRAFGYAGLALLIAVAVGLTMLIIGLRLRRWMRPVETCAALMIIALGLLPVMLARPMVLAWPVLAWWTEELLRARERDTTPRLYLIPLMTLWVNLHASFAVGLAVAAFFGLDALVGSRDRRQAFVRWGLFGMACSAATLLNPNGLTNVLLPLSVFISPTVGFVSEFKPTAPANYPGFELALVALIAFALWRGARLAAVRLLLVIVLLHLSLAHIRHQSIFLIVTALVVLPAMSARWLAGNAPKPSFLEELGQRRSGVGRAAGAAALLFAILSAARLLVPVSPIESDVNPAHALDSIPMSLRTERVLNEYSLGGPLILRGFRVFMDGRTDVYGDNHFLEYLAIFKGDSEAFSREQRKWQFCWSIFPANSSGILRVLDASPGWERIYADEWAIIHVRRPCGSQFTAASGMANGG